MKVAERPKNGMRERLARWWNGAPKRRPRGESVRQRIRYGPLGPVAYTPTGIGYGAKKSMREMGYPQAQNATPDAHLRYELDELVAESQRLARDNTILRTMKKRLIDLVVGSGRGLQARTDNERLNKDIETWYRERMRRPEIRGLDNNVQFQRKLVDHVLTDGRILLIKDEKSGKVQAIPGDRLWTLSPWAEQSSAYPNRIEHGVEIDGLGRIVRFHIAEWDELGLTRHDNGTTVEASEAIYWARRERFEETAGPPPLHPIFAHLHRLNTIFDNIPAAWELLTRFAIKVNKKNAGAAGFNLSNPPDGNPGRTRADERIHEFGWGVMFWGDEDEDIGGVEHNIPSPDTDQSVKCFLRICGMELGLSLPFFLLDWSEVNYSSGRASAIQLWRNAGQWGEELEATLSADYEWALRREVRRGTFPDRFDITAHEWVADPFQPLDADKEFKANQTAMNSGQKTLTRTLKEAGREREEHFAERASELADAATLVKAHNDLYPDQPITIAQFLGEQPDAANTPGAKLDKALADATTQVEVAA